MPLDYERLELFTRTALLDAEDSAGAAMVGLALRLGLLGMDEPTRGWDIQRRCAQWALEDTPPPLPCPIAQVVFPGLPPLTARSGGASTADHA